MGSLEEEDLNQMVRDYIEFGSSSSSDSSSISKFSSSSSLSSLNIESFLINLKEILGSYTYKEEPLIEEKVSMFLKNMGIINNKQDKSKKMIVTKLKTEGFKASLCKNSWTNPSLNCLEVSRMSDGYEYIDIILEDQKRVIVDMDFNSQFELARPTEFYKELINTLPVIFVGSEDKLNKVISLLCSAAKQSFKENDLHFPPWRKSNYMQSKWEVKYCKRISVSPSKKNLQLVVGVEQVNNTTSTSSCCPSIFC
ncbi:hypothetical protein ACFE04_025724 [Oxalis oulophora]